MKTMHKTWKALVCFLVLSLLCSAFTIAFMPAAVKAQAQTPPADEQPPSTAYSEGLDFYTIEDGTYGVMVSDFSIQYAIIPEEYEGIPVTEVFDYGFSYCTELEEVFIPKTVKRIGYDAFSGCEKLIWVDLSYVEEISGNSFSFCTNLKTVLMPENPTYIGQYNFMESAPEIYLIQSVEEANSWGDWLNSYGGNVQRDVHFTHTDKVYTFMGDGYQLTKFGKYNNPSADLQFDNHNGSYGVWPITDINSNAFANTIANSIAILGDANKSVNLRSSAFANANVNAIWVSENVTFNDPGRPPLHQSLGVFSSRFVKEIRLPALTEIPQSTFSNTLNLNKIRFHGFSDNVLPASVTSIGRTAFSNSKLPSLYIPATVTDIAMNAFGGWTDKQVIQTEFYSDAIPATWLSWASVKATVKYCGAIVDLKINNAGSAAADVTVKAPFNAAGRTNLAAVLNQAGLPDLSYDGYAFTNRWYREAACQNEVLTTDNITEDTTLYARWDKYYTVTLVTEQAGVVDPDDVQPLSHVWDGTLFEALGVVSPASDSHNFTKWYTDEARTAAFDASTPIQSNLTLYAGWDVKKHSVSFVTEQNGVLNPGGIAAKTDVPYGTVFGTLGVASPSSDSHNFTRWYTDESRTVAFDASTPIRGDMTLYAGWSIKRFTINFINNGHVHFYENGKLLADSKTYDYGYNLKFTVSVSNGYKFDSISHNNEILSPQNGVYSVTVTAAGDIKVNNERGIVYTIVYDANGGSGFIEPQYGIVYDTYVKLKDSAFGRTGYYVACWQTEAGAFKAGQGTSAAGNSYALNTSYKNLANEDNDTVTLFAVWKPVTYTIRFVSNKPGNTAGVMSGNMADCVFTYDVGKYLPANGYTLTGWFFTGWSLTPGEHQPIACYNEDYILNRFDHQNTVLYAQWVKYDYEIKHDLSGYTPEFWYYINYDGKQDITLAQYYTLPVKYDIDSNIIFGRPGIQGYSAVWNIPSVTPGSRTGDITIKATWSEITYTVYHHVKDSDQPDFEKEETFQMRYTEIKDIWAWSRTGVIDRQFVNWEVKAGYMSFSNAILEYGLNATFALNDVNHSVDDPNKGYGLRIEKFGYIENAYVHLIEHTMNNACVAEGSMITLADGSQKAVEQLTGDELLLVWNLKTGTFDVAPILFIDSEALRSYEITHLYFSDGTEIKVINEHGFWDFDLNQYVFLRNDAAKYVGHWFNKQTTDSDGSLSWTKVQLVQVQVYFTETTAWSPVTAEHLCYYVNGMLSMPGATEGLINIFEVDGEAMQYDPDALTADIEKYGLFTYEEFAELIPVTEEVFNIFGGQYLKVSIGKGLIDMETIASLIERYSALL